MIETSLLINCNLLEVFPLIILAPFRYGLLFWIIIIEVEPREERYAENIIWIWKDFLADQIHIVTKPLVVVIVYE